MLFSLEKKTLFCLVFLGDKCPVALYYLVKKWQGLEGLSLPSTSINLPTSFSFPEILDMSGFWASSESCGTQIYFLATFSFLRSVRYSVLPEFLNAEILCVLVSNNCLKQYHPPFICFYYFFPLYHDFTGVSDETCDNHVCSIHHLKLKVFPVFLISQKQAQANLSQLWSLFNIWHHFLSSPVIS